MSASLNKNSHDQTCDRCRAKRADPKALVPQLYVATYKTVCESCAVAVAKTARMFVKEFPGYHFGGKHAARS